MPQTLTAAELLILKSKIQAGASGHSQKVTLNSYIGGVSTLRNPYYVSATLMPNGKPALLMRGLDTPYSATTIYFLRYLTESVVAQPVQLFPYNTAFLSIATYAGLLVAIAYDATNTRIRMRTSADNGVTWSAEATLGGLTFATTNVATGARSSLILRANKAQTTLYLFYSDWVAGATFKHVLYRSTTNADPTTGWSAQADTTFVIPSVGRNYGGGSARNQGDTRAFAIVETKTAGTWVIAAESDDGDWHANHAFFQGTLGGAWTRKLNDGYGGGLSGGQGSNGNVFLDRNGDVIGYAMADNGDDLTWWRSLDSGATWSSGTQVIPSGTTVGMGAGDGLAVPGFVTKEFIWGGRAGLYDTAPYRADLLVVKVLAVPVLNIFDILGPGAAGGNVAQSSTTDVSDRVISISFDKATQLDSDTFTIELHNEDAALNINTDTPAVVPSTAYRDAVLTDTPASYYRLGEASGTVAADASSGGTRPGTYSGGYGLGYTQGIGDNDTAAHFDGVDGQMVAALPGLGATSATLEAWVYLDAVPNKGTFIKAGDTSNGYGIGVGNGDFDSSGSKLVVLFENTRWIDTGYVLSAQVWTHIALVITAAGKPIVYVNGAQVYTDTGTATSAPTTNLSVGGYTKRWVTGRIDEVAAYNAIVSAARLLAHYNARGTAPTGGSGPLSPYVKPNVIVDVYQWHGVVANSTQTFHGIVDSVRQHDSPRTVVLTGRCGIKKLLVQEVRLIAGQDLKVVGYVRDTSNFVYLNKTLNEVLTHILDYAGIAPGVRAFAPSTFVFKELRGNDQETLMDLARRACDVAGQELWCDELGIFKTRAIGAKVATSSWTFRSYEDITVLDPDTDDDTLKTRVRILGKANIGAKYLAEQFKWPGPETPGSTNGPAAIAYDPTTATVWVLTQNSNLYRLDPNANMAVVAGPFALGLGYPDGLSVDPLDNHLWISDGLNASTGNNAGRVYKKINRATQALMLGPFTNPDGDHCAIWAWNNAGTIRLKMTTYTSGKIVTMSIAGAEVSRVNSPATNPTALTSDTGGGLYLSAWDSVDFFQIDFAGNIVNRIAQPDKNGNAISAVEDSAVYDFGAVYEAFRDQNLIVKYAPTTPTGVDTATYAEVVNAALEQSLVGEVRLARLTDLAITDKAQATKTAQRQLDRLSIYAKHITVGVLGNPGIQKGDRITVVVPGASINGDWTVISCRSDQNARNGTWLMVLVLVPYRALA